MISDELGMELHDRYTLDELLTPQEHTQLEAWYAQKDSAEAALLEKNQPQLPNLAMLQAQLDATLAQLTAVIQRLQQITLENDSIREEVAALKQQLATPRSA